MPRFYCCNPLCPRINGFREVECPDCHYTVFVADKYKAVQEPYNKANDKVTIKVVQADIHTAQTPYILKIIRKSNNVSSDLSTLNSFKDKTKKAKTADLIDIIEIEYSKNKRDPNSTPILTEYVGIISEFIDGEKITQQKNRIKQNYKKEFTELLKSLESLHDLGIVHGKITEQNILYHEQSWKIVDVYPKVTSNPQAKTEDLKTLTRLYANLFEGEGDNPFHSSKNDSVVEDVINNILSGRKITTTEEAIRALENKFIYDSGKAFKYSWNLLQNIIKQIQNITTAGKTLFFAIVLVSIGLMFIGAISNGQNPIKVASELITVAQNIIKPNTNPNSYKVDKDWNFVNDLNEIETELNKNNLIAADIKTRELMLKIFADPGDRQNNSKVVHDIIQVNFEASQNSNGVTSIGDNKIISQTQKKRVQEIDRVWFYGTQGKHGFYRQQKVYQTVSSDYTCNKRNHLLTDKEKDNDHVDATFKALGWGARGCNKTINPIPHQIYDVMKGPGVWNVKRQKIQEIFKNNGGVGDNDNVPDGYYPITAGLVAQQQFPQFVKWCGYTEKDLEEKKNTNQ